MLRSDQNCRIVVDRAPVTRRRTAHSPTSNRSEYVCMYASVFASRKMRPGSQQHSVSAPLLTKRHCVPVFAVHLNCRNRCCRSLSKNPETITVPVVNALIVQNFQVSTSSEETKSKSSRLKIIDQWSKFSTR